MTTLEMRTQGQCGVQSNGAACAAANDKHRVGERGSVLQWLQNGFSELQRTEVNLMEVQTSCGWQ